MLKKIINFFSWFKTDTRARSIVLISCIIGTLFGFYYYQGQFEITPLYLWFFVPDSPFFTFMYVIILTLYFMGYRSNPFDVFTFIGLTKVGLWTIFVLFLNSDYYFSPETREYRFVILLLHIGMILVGLTLLNDMRKLSLSWYCFILGFFIISDYLDYFIGTHPIIPLENVETVKWVTFALSIFTCIFTFYYLENEPKEFNT